MNYFGQRALGCAVIAGILGVIAGIAFVYDFAFGVDAYVYVENGGSQPMTSRLHV